jgi:hypothetical protein
MKDWQNRTHCECELEYHVAAISNCRTRVIHENLQRANSCLSSCIDTSWSYGPF